MSAFPPNPSGTAAYYASGTAPGQAPPVPPWFIAGAPAQPRFDRARLVPTMLVAAIIGAVVLGGIGLDKAISAPSAGRVNIGGPVYITAGSGWVIAPQSGDSSGSGVKLQKGNSIFVAVAVPGYSGDASAALAEARTGLDDGSAQISFSSVEHPTLGGHATAAVGFEAIISNQQRAMTIDGELICMVLGSNAVVIEAFAPQGDFQLAIDDIKAMASSVEVTQ